MDERRISRMLDILDYWYVMEFLTQGAFDRTTDYSNVTGRVKKYHMRLKRGGKPQNSISAFVDPKEGSLRDALITDAQSLQMKGWGNTTVYIGKIPRESCMDKLVQYLDPEEKEYYDARREKLVVASFRIDPFGCYILGSFALSPILWSLRRAGGITDVSGLKAVLTIEQYQKDIEKMEKLLLGRGEEQGGMNMIGEDGFPEFSQGALSDKTLQKLKDIIWKDCFLPVFGDDEELHAKMEECYYKVLFYRDRAKVEEREEYPNRLQDSFYLEDLKLVRNYIRQGKALGKGIMPTVMNFIDFAAYEKAIAGEQVRMDVVHPDDVDRYKAFMKDHLSISRMPLGKWPSRYTPAMMQQLAINIAIGRDGSAKDTDYCFSVNGPPGTGKTTLIKEIVANNIVEKAGLLATYKKADDAFAAHSLKSEVYPHWYSLKDERIGELGILVASNNNTAVENISRQLPVREEISGAMKAGAGDSEKMRQLLQEVDSLFDPDKVTREECIGIYYDHGERKERTAKEIYYTKYAQDLLGDRGEIWGLVSAPMGRMGNIWKFADKVLKSMLLGGMLNKRKESIAERQVEFNQAKQEFQAQLKKVKNLQSKLLDNETTIEKYQNIPKVRETIKKNKNEIFQQEKVLVKLQKEYDSLAGTKASAESKHKAACKATSKIRNKMQSLKKSEASLKDRIDALKKEEKDVRASVGMFAGLFKSASYRQAEQRCGEIQSSISKLEADLRNNKSMQRERESALKKALAKESEASKRLDACKKQCEKKAKKANKVGAAIAKLERWNNEADNEISRLEKRFDYVMHASEELPDVRRFIPLEDNLLGDLRSEDQTVSTTAHNRCPWVNAAYDREREKLMYAALEVCRTFVLSSWHCRTNFRLFCNCWRVSVETTGLVKIPDKDRVAMMPSLLQTLSILVPVMSTTFASVEHMMKDVSEPSSLGTLIIDEAGQALPQSALGAIFRAKKVLVLGDPKQVEPIVTDEFQLLKAAYTDEWIQPYKQKTLSVQRMVDALNPVGTYLEDEAGTQQWVGSPLLVHRRCISPMFDISNQLSYMGIMKQMTPAPNADTEAIMALERSQWIDISGAEYGKKNHYVPEQGNAVQMILREAFRKNPYPDLFIISPFTSVVSGIRKSISEWQKQVPLTEDNKSMDRWKKDQIGTVHAFQGKEAKEVIFLLGCDASPRAYGAVQWVHSNIVNVAVTRAKYRLYVIGDQQVWKRNDNLRHVLDNIQVISFEKEQGEV